jgi:hypothetical protein
LTNLVSIWQQASLLHSELANLLDHDSQSSRHQTHHTRNSRTDRYGDQLVVGPDGYLAHARRSSAGQNGGANCHTYPSDAFIRRIVGNTVIERRSSPVSAA